MSDERAAPSATSKRAGLGFARGLSRLLLFAERLTPLVLPLALVVSLFLMLSWFG